MDIQEAREAFERRQAKALNVPYEGLKAHFDENSRLFGARYNAGSINEKEWNLWLEAWQAKAQSVPEGFVLMPKEPTKDTLIEIASVCIGDDFANLDEAKELYKAAIKAQHPSSTSGCPDEP